MLMLLDRACLHNHYDVGNVLKAVLTLYMEDKSLSLPTLEEVLICNSNTTAEEVSVLFACTSTYYNNTIIQ